MKRYHILLLLLFTLVNVVAQDLRKFSVVSFEEKPFDLTATDERYKIVDGNGALFSVIKLVSATPDDDLTAYSFDFGLCEDREKTINGERWIYVQRNAMHATIKREGFQTEKYELNLTVQEGKVYEMVLQAVPKVIQRQFLLFEVSPADSKAYITYKKANVSGEYKPFGDGSIDAGGSLAKSLELGVYAYKIISGNYHVSEGIVTLDSPNEKHIEKVELRPNFANVTLKTVNGVDIYIDEEKKATGTWSGKLSPGTYSVECRKEYHKSSFETITVEEGKDFTLQLKAPTPITGILSISSNPLKAVITIDGKKYGETPDFIEGLLIGEHKVELSLDGYKSESRNVTILEGEPLEIAVDLKKINETGKINVSSSPDGASVSIGGVKYGKTPCMIDNLLPGTYIVALNKRGCTPITQPVTVKAGETSSVLCKLDNKKEDVQYKQKKTYKKKYVNNTESLFENKSFYMHYGVSVPMANSGGVAFGGYVKNVNCELLLYLGWVTVPCCLTDGYSFYSVNVRNRNTPRFKLGYGFKTGKRFRFTPQLGISSIIIETVKEEEKDFYIATYPILLDLGVKCDFAVMEKFGFTITPEYSYAVRKDELFKSLASFSPKARRLGNGFNINLGFYIVLSYK